MASLALGVCLLVPLFIERFTIWEKIGWQYALAGVLLLLLVFVFPVVIAGNGSRTNINTRAHLGIADVT